MSTHDEIEELADLAAAGAWEPDAHATSCGTCAATVTAAREFRAWAAGAIVPDAPPDDLEDRVIARFRATNTAAVRRLRLLPGKRFLKWAAGTAAAVGLVVLGGGFTLPSTSRDGTEGDPVAMFDTVSDGLALHSFRSVDVSGRKVSEEGLEKELAHRRLGVGDEAGLFALVSPTAGGAGPLTGATFSLDTGLVKDGDNAAHSTSWGFSGTAQRVNDATALTKLEADAQVFVRQSEVQRAQLQELNQKLDESRSKLGKALAEKSTSVAEVEYARQQAERLSQELAALEEKTIEQSRSKKVLEEKINAVALAGGFVEDRGVQIATAATSLDPIVPGTPVTDPYPAVKPGPATDLKLAQDARKLIRGARLTMEVDAYEAAQAKVAAAAAEEKGFVASADTERLQNGKIRATVTLRVPPDRFEALLAKLRALGTVKRQSLGTQDVTKGYVDMEARLGAKQALLDRLKKVLAEAKGNVKELMEVEVQMGATLEQIEALKGELKYLDNQVGLATVTLELAEKDLGQPFEYVQTLQSRIGLVTSDVDKAYVDAQKAVLDAGGQVVDSKMTRQNDGAATGTIKARVEAAKFPDVRQALRGLGHVETDTVDQQKTARGGEPTSSAPVRVEQATIDLSVSTPALLITRRAQIRVETKDVEAVYLASRKTSEAAGGRVLDGGLSNRSDGGSASLTVQVDVDKFSALVSAFKGSGEVKHAVVNQSAGVVAVPVRERAEIILVLQSPPAILGEEHGIARTVRETFARSWGGLLWSIEKLFVGLSLAGPWLLAAGLGWLGWRRARRRKPAPAQ
jgi:hypothetical protein